jgi:hypothetical protein
MSQKFWRIYLAIVYTESKMVNCVLCICRCMLRGPHNLKAAKSVFCQQSSDGRGLKDTPLKCGFVLFYIAVRENSVPYKREH